MSGRHFRLEFVLVALFGIFSTTSAIIEILHHFNYHRCLFKQRIRIVNLDSEVSDRF